jgi:hypothetical protein
VSVVETDVLGCVGTAVTVSVQIGTSIGIDMYGGSTDLLIFPNPFSQSTTVQFNNANSQPYVLVVYDMLGNKVREVKNITSNQVLVEKGNLNAGVYFVELQGTDRLYRGRVMID